jgi:hypothetical protein
VEPPGGDAFPHRLAAQPSRGKLPGPRHAVLPRRERGEHYVGCTTFVNHLLTFVMHP